MVWYVFAILGALFDSTFYMLSKRLLHNINQYVLAAGAFLSGAGVLLLISLFRGIPEIGPAFYPAVATTGSLNAIAAVLYYKALKTTDLSLTIPMISFTPVFLIFTSLLLLNEFPTTPGIAGILLIVTGSYILNSKGGTHLLEPFRQIFKNRGIFYMLIVAFLFSISANFDKIVVRNSDPFFGSSVVFLFIGLVFLGLSMAMKCGVKISYSRDYPSFLLVGSLLALEAIAINVAYTQQMVPYVISLKRLSILFSVFYGGLVFKEENILVRGLGAFIITAGVLLIILYES